MAGLSAPDTRPGDTIVVRRSRLQGDGLYALLVAVLALIMVRVLTGSRTTTGRVVGLVCFGALLVLFTTIWLLLRRHPAQLEVSADRIRYVTGPKGDNPDFVRTAGDEVMFRTSVSGSRSSMMILTQTATGLSWQLPLFNRTPIVAACRARGWRVTGRGIGPGDPITDPG